ncbi:MAG: outer membrane beta-barrel protein [Candidatus Krumholzibacteria bacterium]|nr:outer membrane beta-barrel protein [Candidatus Krumholzibacteria bacterium]
MMAKKFFSGLLLVMMVVSFSAAVAWSEDTPQVDSDTPDSRYYRDGFFVGVDLGVGVGELKFVKDGDKHVGDKETGALAGFRAGYAFSRVFVLDAGLYGYSIYGGDPKLQLAAAMVTGNFYPLPDKGYFLKVGVGRGRVDVDTEIDGNTLEFTEIEGNMFGLGFGVEFPMGGKFLVGGSYDYRLTYLDDQDDVTDLVLRTSGLTIQGKLYF